VTPNTRPRTLALELRGYTLAFLLFFCILTVTAFSQSQQSTAPDRATSATISVNSDLVAIPVRVTDSNGNVI
jgi:hypothetical protein